MTKCAQWFVIAASIILASASGIKANNLSVAKDQLVQKGHAIISGNNAGILLTFDNPAEDSGLTINPPKGQECWDFSGWKYLSVDIENHSHSVQLRLLMQTSSIGPDGKTDKDVSVGIGLNPGEKRTLRLLIPHEWYYGSPAGVPGVHSINSARVKSVDFFVQWPFESTKKDLVNCRLSNLRVEEPMDSKSGPRTLPDKYAPFIDEYGQFIHDEWPAKIHSATDYRRNYIKEKAELDAVRRPEEWNRFGGWKNGPQLKATGSFRTEKYQGKWYLVDPDGRLFFSTGLDVISRYNDALKVMPGKRNWFKKIPDGADNYQATETALRLKYGTENYFPEYLQNVSKRLDAWGINTLGDWSMLELMDLGRTPYTLQLTDYDWGMPRLGDSKLKFYDVFDPRYIEKMKNLMQIAAKKEFMVNKSLTDPMCIGYWIDNELDFGNRGRPNFADEVIKCPSKQAAKQELLQDLKVRYGNVNSLNQSWKTDYKNWDEFLNSTNVPQDNDAYRQDSSAFQQKAVEQYFRLARDAVKSVAPNRLYLGCRFISTDAVRPVLAKASQKYCDILSVNIYSHSAANFPVESMPDMPMIIGEFHFGVLDRGMFNAAIQAGVTQQDRALAYTRFMQGVLVHPNFVGAHWFQYRDQPLTGRGDGEAYQIGFVDVADTPYEELCRAARLVGENMYQYRMNGKLTNLMTGGAK